MSSVTEYEILVYGFVYYVCFDAGQDKISKWDKTRMIEICVECNKS